MSSHGGSDCNETADPEDESIRQNVNIPSPIELGSHVDSGVWSEEEGAKFCKRIQFGIYALIVISIVVGVIVAIIIAATK